jgi:hypothetical protein
MNDRDFQLLPAGNMLRFALPRRGQNSQVCTHGHARPCRGTAQTLAGPGYHLPELNLTDPTDNGKSFLPARTTGFPPWGESLGVR